jgi:hypothetical protein
MPREDECRLPTRVGAVPAANASIASFYAVPHYGRAESHTASSALPYKFRTVERLEDLIELGFGQALYCFPLPSNRKNCVSYLLAYCWSTRSQEGRPVSSKIERYQTRNRKDAVTRWSKQKRAEIETDCTRANTRKTVINRARLTNAVMRILAESDCRNFMPAPPIRFCAACIQHCEL